MADSNQSPEIAELRQSLAVLHLDLLVHKGFSGSARWRAERGVDVALEEFNAAGRVLADTGWSEDARPAAENAQEALRGYQNAISAFDSTRENLYRTLLSDSIWGLKAAIFGWEYEQQVHVKEGKSWM